jgi:hypothetical protein
MSGMSRAKDERPIPRKALQLVYDLAREMSGCNTYMVMDDDGELTGEVDPKILKALLVVKEYFKLSGDP